VYPVVFIDCIHVKVRDGQVADRPVCVALAVTVDGHRDILGLWVGDGGEGAKYWLQVLTELKNRGVEDVCMVVCDGAEGPANSRIRKAVRARGHFPNEQAALKCVYMAVMSLDPTGTGRKRWTMRWKDALQAFDIAFHGRLSIGRH
jgi:transposase-like protein